MSDVPPAPVSERGFVVDQRSSSGWWAFEEAEQVPELRWPLSNYVFDKMRRSDSQARSVLRAVELPIRSTTWRIDPNGARDEVVAQVAEDLGLPIVGMDPAESPKRRRRDRFSWPEHLRHALLSLPFGHMYFEQVVRIDDAGRARLRKLGPRMPRTICAVNVADDGGLVSIEQAAGAGKVVIPVSRLVAYVHEREGGNWLGTSILRPAYKHWIIKDRLLRVQAQTIDRNGMGIPVYEAAAGEVSLDNGLQLAKDVRAGDNSGAAVPNGAKLDLKGVTGTLPDADPAIRYHDEQIARAVLAHFLNLGTQTGSWALGSTFADFFVMSLQGVANDIADVATKHVVEDLVDWNWGIDEGAPAVVFDEIGSEHRATAAALKLLVDAGILFPDRGLEEAIRQMFDLPPKSQSTPATS